MMSVGLHLRISGHPARRASRVANFIEYAKSFPGCLVCPDASKSRATGWRATGR